MAQQDQNVCKYDKYGFCKFRTTCRKQHIKEICSKMAVKVKNVTWDILKCVGTTEKLDTVNLENGVCLNMKVMSTRKWKKQ